MDDEDEGFREVNNNFPINCNEENSMDNLYNAIAFGDPNKTYLGTEKYELSLDFKHSLEIKTEDVKVNQTFRQFGINRFS